jgi:hypothetical protein
MSNFIIDSDSMTEEKIKEIRKDPENQDWNCISIVYKLSEEFIREFKEKVVWEDIFTYQVLSMCFIEEFKDKIKDFDRLFMYQDLSEDFIRRFKHRVDWYYIFRNQNLSEAFLIEFMNNIDDDFIDLTQNEKIPQELKDKIIAMRELID